MRNAKYKCTIYAELTKLKLSAMNGLSPLFGLAATGVFDPATACALFVGNTLMAMSSQTIGQVVERDRDALMSRTRNRPLPTSRISVSAAQATALGTFLASNAILFPVVSPVSLFLSNLTLLGYVAYLKLKTLTSLNTLFGSVVGSMPLLIGATAVQPSASNVAAAGYDFLYLCFWQYVHFFNILWRYKADYQKAGFVMLYDERKVMQLMLFSLAAISLIIYLKYRNQEKWFALPSLLVLSHVLYSRQVLSCYFFNGCKKTLLKRVYTLFFFYYALFPVLNKALQTVDIGVTPPLLSQPVIVK